ncbi:hypothetical protein [Phytohabitans houttuyneae]|uniref:Uncharacterized protein n=1 Tax=Phytohabitans houttuyneae TaxID=1076126 RepID=A0A6V8JTZ9_9ACTN|nr:hypothetical protein [Phytohabitans houttuyneae]GFJ76033.1 hypothetical protein Phou_002130 [Phytohabitans houttuyneae]
MRFAGVGGEHEPDPRLEWREQARRMPVPVFGLVPQRHAEDWDAIGLGSGTVNGVLESCEVSVTYTLWRNPDDPDDPVNLAELDDEQRRALAEQPPWARAPWLEEQVRRMRYPALWECVRTRWTREPGEFDTVRALLVEHVNHIVANQFRRTRVVGDHPPYEVDSPVNERCAEPGIPVVVDGVTRDGLRIDTDPDVYGVGVDLDPHTVLTAAVPRDDLPYLQMAFATRPI